MKRLYFFLMVLCLVVIPCFVQAETVTLVYQNDLHGWLFPSSTGGPGLGKMARILDGIFEEEPSSFYGVAGDLFTGPNLPEDMKGKAELDMWNRFCQEIAGKGYGERILISAGNHEFDYGLPSPEAFDSGLLCANLFDDESRPYYTPFKIIRTNEGLRVGFVGLVLEKNGRVLGAARDKGLEVVPMLKAARRFLEEMGTLDLTVLMIHAHMGSIKDLVQRLPKDLGVDLILSGHEHLTFEKPVKVEGIYVLQAGAMNNAYGRADLEVEKGRVVSLENRIVPLRLSALDRTMMRVKEEVDACNGERVALLKSSLMGASRRSHGNSLGRFVSDAFRWATEADVAMTNSSSLRKDFIVYPGEPIYLREGHFRQIVPYENHLMSARVKGKQILKILEGEAMERRNQISGLTCVIDYSRPKGKRVVRASIQGEPLVPEKEYTLVHNSFCARDENMERYLHLESGSVDWKDTGLVDNEVLAGYARHLEVVNYAEDTPRIRAVR